MKKMMLLGCVALAMTACAADEGGVEITVPKDFKGKTLVVNHVALDNMFKAQKQEDLKVYYDTLEVKNGVAKLKLDPIGPSRYNIESPTPSRFEVDFYACPGEKLKINISDFDPLEYTVSGTALMEDLTELYSITKPIQSEYITLINSKENVTQEEVKAVFDKYDAAVKKFVNDNPKSPAVPFAITDLSSEDFKKYYDTMTPEAKKSILMPFAEGYNKEVEKALKERADEEAKKAEIASGKLDAPAFTLPDLNGKKVSLSDFKGKWVVLDFWGSWCGWCVKGFPALKEAYMKYGDKIQIIGIDCNESEADWRAGVKKYELPWINVYNGDNRDLYAAYNITGFPTKVIINPEGKLVDVTTGEDPSFYTRLATFVE